MLISSRCHCGRPATCQCGKCVLHCHCPTAEEMAEIRRQQIARQRTTVITYVRTHAAEWEWGDTQGEFILWDGRVSHVGEYLAANDQAHIWLNRFYGDGRGMLEYNYGARSLPDDPARPGPTNYEIIADLARLAGGELLPNERVRQYKSPRRGNEEQHRA